MQFKCMRPGLGLAPRTNKRLALALCVRGIAFLLATLARSSMLPPRNRFKAASSLALLLGGFFFFLFSGFAGAGWPGAPALLPRPLWKRLPRLPERALCTSGRCALRPARPHAVVSEAAAAGCQEGKGETEPQASRGDKCS